MTPLRSDSSYSAKRNEKSDVRQRDADAACRAEWR